MILNNEHKSIITIIIAIVYVLEALFMTLYL